MAKSISFLCFSCILLFSFSGYEAHKIHINPNPNDTSLHTSTPKYNQYPLKKTMNVIDSCWRSDPDWASNRQALADCAKGFGSGALGGKNGAIYVVNDPSDDPVNPKPGTLRYGAIQDKPLWIIFEKDMVIELGNVLMVNSYKSIDGRGAKVEIANGPCITIEDVNHVIIHGISIHDCKPAKPGMLLRSPGNLSKREGSDGDGITVFASSYIWIDHCYLASCTDGLLDVIHASTFVTVSNNYFTKHNKVFHKTTKT